MPQIKTFEEACAALGLDPTHLPEVSLLPEKHQKAIVSHYKLVTIAEALNEGWQPNWNDYDEYKYFPWFDVIADAETPSGSGLSFYVYSNADSYALVGSRLCYRTRELAKYAGKQFADLYQDYFLIG